MAPRAISLWSHRRPLKNGICRVAKYSGPTNSTSASWFCEAGLRRISTRWRQPLSGGVAFVDIPAESTPATPAILSRSSVKKRARSAQVVSYAVSIKSLIVALTTWSLPPGATLITVPFVFFGFDGFTNIRFQGLARVLIAEPSEYEMRRQQEAKPPR